MYHFSNFNFLAYDLQRNDQPNEESNFFLDFYLEYHQNQSNVSSKWYLFFKKSRAVYNCFYLDVEINQSYRQNVTKKKNWKDVHYNQKSSFVSYLDQKPTSSDQ